MDETAPNENLIICQTNQGTEIRAEISRLTRHQAVFEILNPAAIVQLSEVLPDFKIMLDGRVAYSGRAVVTGLVQKGSTYVCEAALDETCLDPAAVSFVNDPARLRAGFEAFTRDWGKSYRIHPEFKVLLADMHNYLSDLRLWLEQVELGIRSTPSGDRQEMERKALTELSKPVIIALNGLFDKFETVASRVEPQDKPAHRVLARRQVHPFVLSAPFPYRTFHKPLGYPGDYEMVNMILRDPFEGGTMFAKIFNAWFLSQAPAEAHRNRINYLVEKLMLETVRASASGRSARVFNLGCGPAVEVQRYLAEHPVSSKSDFTLLDFNDETIAYTMGLLGDLKRRHQRSTQIHLQKKSVANLLKGRGKSTSGSPESKFDLVYCAGLFDYLPDSICRQLMNILYEMVAPGGLLVATNVDCSNPRCLTMDYMMEWTVIYRTGAQLASLKPDLVPADEVKVMSDYTGVNLYFEARKPLRE